MKNIITKLMIAVTIIAAIIGLASCYTQRTAQRQVYKAHHKYPLVPARFCAELYPPVDSTSTIKEYIPGNDIVVTETTVDTFNTADTIIITRNITKAVRTTDTLRDTKYVQLENKAAIASQNAENKEVAAENVSLSTSRHFWRLLAIAGWSILLLLIGWKVAKLYLK